MAARVGLAALLAGTTFVAACGYRPITASDVKIYTAIPLSPADRIVDLTTRDERDTVPGFSYHIIVRTSVARHLAILDRLRALSNGWCTPARISTAGCFIEDTRPATRMSTTVIAVAGDARTIDLRFYE